MPAACAVVGLVEVIHHIPRIYGEFRKLIRAAETERPDLAILTDSPDFNLRVASEVTTARYSGHLPDRAPSLGLAGGSRPANAARSCAGLVHLPVRRGIFRPPWRAGNVYRTSAHVDGASLQY